MIFGYGFERKLRKFENYDKPQIDVTYWEQLHALSMYSLERRREVPHYIHVAYYGRSSQPMYNRLLSIHRGQSLPANELSNTVDVELIYKAYKYKLQVGQLFYLLPPSSSSH